MNIILNFMDKIYGDSKTLSIIYVVGAVLLFIFIILLIISLRKPDKKEKTKIIEEPKIEDDKTNTNSLNDVNVLTSETEKPLEENKVDDVNEKDDIKEESISSQNIFEKTTIIPINKDNLEKEIDKSYNKEENIEKALDNAENMSAPKEETKEEVDVSKLSSEIPSVDDFVDDVVKKTYEKNEQFSSVYVDNTDTVKLDKVMENLNVDKDVKENLAPTEEKEEVELPKETEIKVAEKTTTIDNKLEEVEEKKPNNTSNLDELKAKLNNLSGKTNPTGAVNKEELLSKLNSLKEQNK